MDISAKDIKLYVTIALIGLGGYVLYKSLQGLGMIAGAANQAICSATATLANWYVQLTSSGAAIPTGMILLPDGTAVPVASLQVSSVSGTNSATFNYNGNTYYLNSPHDSNGNWAASLTLGS